MEEAHEACRADREFKSITDYFVDEIESKVSAHTMSRCPRTLMPLEIDQEEIALSRGRDVDPARA